MGLYDRDGFHVFLPATASHWDATDRDAVGRWATVSVDGTPIGSLYTDDVGSVGFMGNGNRHPLLTPEINRRILELAGTSADSAYDTVVRELSVLADVEMEHHSGPMTEFFGH